MKTKNLLILISFTLLVGCVSPHTRLLLDDLNIDMNELKTWEKAGIHGKSIAKFKELNLSPSESKKWLALDGVKSPYDIERFIESGIATPDNLKEWRNSGFSDNKAKHYSSKKLSINESIVDKKWDDIVEKLYPNAYFDGKRMNAWKKSGIGIKTAQKWIDLTGNLNGGLNWINSGVSDMGTVKKWMEAGVNISTIKSLKKQNYNTPLQFKKTCPSLIDDSDFISNNPYKFVKQCVHTCVKINQVLSKNNVFGYIRDKRAISANAKGSLADDFTQGNLICGIYKIKKATKFNLVLGNSVTGNTLDRISSHDNLFLYGI